MTDIFFFSFSFCSSGDYTHSVLNLSLNYSCQSIRRDTPANSMLGLKTYNSYILDELKVDTDRKFV